MKTQTDPRHQKRIERFKNLFTYSFEKGLEENPENIVTIIEKIDDIDELIQKVAPEWPIDRLNKIDLAILRLAIFELLIEKSIPPKVVIDEAVEIGKLFGAESTSKFVNGVLGALMKKRDIPAQL